MRMRKLPPEPEGLACGALEDNGRFLFLLRQDSAGHEALELPCVLVHKGQNSVSLLGSAFAEQTGIDGEVQEVIAENRHNAGTRKRKKWVAVLVFRVRAKKANAKPGAGFSGYKWLAIKDAKGMRRSRNLEWL